MSDWLDEAVKEEGALMFSEHPESRDLVMFADAPAELDHDLRLGIEAHLRLCDACGSDLARLQAATRELSTDPTPDPAPTLSERLARLLAPRFLIPVVSMVVAAVAVFGPGGDGPALTPVGRSVVLRAEVERGDAPTALPDPDGRLSLTFSLAGDGDGPIEHCAVTVLDVDDHTVARLAELAAFDTYGTFMVILDATEISAGPYRLVAEDRLGERTFGFSLQEQPGN